MITLELSDHLTPPVTAAPLSRGNRYACSTMTSANPTNIDIRKNKGVVLTWPDGRSTYYSVAYLRKMSPSADMRHLREEMKKNPLTVLPASAFSNKPLVITHAELAGHYALKLEFSDGHTTGIYSWDFLREIDPHLDPPSDWNAGT